MSCLHLWRSGMNRKKWYLTCAIVISLLFILDGLSQAQGWCRGRSSGRGSAARGGVTRGGLARSGARGSTRVAPPTWRNNNRGFTDSRQAFKELTSTDDENGRPVFLYMTSSDEEKTQKIQTYEDSVLYNEKVCIAARFFDCYQVDVTDIDKDHPILKLIKKPRALTFYTIHGGKSFTDPKKNHQHRVSSRSAPKPWKSFTMSPWKKSPRRKKRFSTSSTRFWSSAKRSKWRASKKGASSPRRKIWLFRKGSKSFSIKKPIWERGKGNFSTCAPKKKRKPPNPEN